MTRKTIKKTLARPLILAGVRREPGETVTLRPDQVERLAPQGYFDDGAVKAKQAQRGK